eukprot:scaffold39702_cov144-Skeletonema_dohrnii-CCMP3373.AAC.4
MRAQLQCTVVKTCSHSDSDVYVTHRHHGRAPLSWVARYADDVDRNSNSRTQAHRPALCAVSAF